MGKNEKPRKEKKHKKKHKRKAKAKSSRVDRKHKKSKSADKETETIDSNYAIPLDLMCSKSHAPETQEEYQLRQQKIRHETDPITGRKRLIKGDGEILEEIVSRKRHLEINKLATQGDGRSFQDHLNGNIQ